MFHDARKGNPFMLECSTCPSSTSYLPSEHSNPQALIPIIPPSTAHTHLSLFNGVKILLGLRPPLAAFRSHGGGVSACSPTACGLWRRKRTRFLLVEQATRCSSCFCLESRRTEFSLSSSSSFPAKPVPVGAGNFFQLIWPVGGVRRLWALDDDLTECLFFWGLKKVGKQSIRGTSFRGANGLERRGNRRWSL